MGPERHVADVAVRGVDPAVGARVSRSKERHGVLGDEVDRAAGAREALEADAGVEGVRLRVDRVAHALHEGHRDGPAEAVADVGVLGAGPQVQEGLLSGAGVHVARGGSEGPPEEVRVVDEVPWRPRAAMAHDHVALLLLLLAVEEVL